MLDAQLRTLQKRLKVLDPLSTNARQTKEEFELVGWVDDIVSGFAARNRASRIDMRVRVRPRGSTRTVHAVKGMFVQVLENLLTNSVFWVAQRHRQQMRAGLAGEDDTQIGEIIVEVDTAVAYLRSATMAPVSRTSAARSCSNRSSARGHKNKAAD